MKGATVTTATKTEDSNEPKSCRIRFDKGETGWALKLPDGTYRINNLPLNDGLNIDDIVECSAESNELPIVKRIITHGMPCKSAVSYQTTEQFYAFVKLVKDAGCKCVGLIGPCMQGQSGSKDGIVIVAHKSDFDPFEVARTLGITDPDSFYRSKKRKKK